MRRTDLRREDKVGIVCCFNGQKRGWEKKLDLLADIFRETGLKPVFSDYIFEREGMSCGTPEQRGRALMDFYRDSSVRAVFDISGGDMANEVLPYLDFEEIGVSDKLFWGYSDLTTVINAIYAKTGRESVLYQVRNLIYDRGQVQRRDFERTALGGEPDLFQFRYRFIQGRELRGIVIGGNIRCFLKLAGTPYFPETEGKVLLLESLSGGPAKMRTYLCQLKQMGVLDRVSGVLLGTFTEMEQEKCSPDMISLIKEYTGSELPVVKTEEIGHGTDSKGIIIGRSIALKNHRDKCASYRGQSQNRAEQETENQFWEDNK